MLWAVFESTVLILRIYERLTVAAIINYNIYNYCDMGICGLIR